MCTKLNKLKFVFGIFHCNWFIRLEVTHFTVSKFLFQYNSENGQSTVISLEVTHFIVSQFLVQYISENGQRRLSKNRMSS